MRLADFAPEYDVASRYQIAVAASPEAVYAAARKLDLSRSRLIRFLFRLRGLPTRDLTLERFLAMGFILLDEVPGQEVVLGLVGRFWTPHGDLQHLSPDAFRAFAEPGYAKAVWNFYITPQPDGGCLLHTETRVQTTDAASRRRFRRYWRLVGPFSGLTRKAMLRAVKEEAEGRMEV